MTHIPTVHKYNNQPVMYKYCQILPNIAKYCQILPNIAKQIWPNIANFRIRTLKHFYRHLKIKNCINVVTLYGKIYQPVIYKYFKYWQYWDYNFTGNWCIVAILSILPIFAIFVHYWLVVILVYCWYMGHNVGMSWSLEAGPCHLYDILLS